MNLYVIIPAHNEAGSVGRVVRELKALPNLPATPQIIVVNNASTDQTAGNALQAGATVLTENKLGYGHACLCALNYLAKLPPENLPDIVAFCDADYADYPEDLSNILAPLLAKEAQLVIGSRLLLPLPPNAMTMPQRFGNWLTALLLRWLYGQPCTDLGPFRAITWPALQQLNMADKTYGWTVEMQAKAAKYGFKTTEIAIKYRPRLTGKSKVSGNIMGVFLAGYKILGTIFKVYFMR